MQYLTFNDKTSIFSYVNDGYFSIKLRQLIWIYKDKTYNGWNGIGGRSAIGEGLQWFFNTIADFPEGGGLQYNIGSCGLSVSWCIVYSIPSMTLRQYWFYVWFPSLYANLECSFEIADDAALLENKFDGIFDS